MEIRPWTKLLLLALFNAAGAGASPPYQLLNGAYPSNNVSDSVLRAANSDCRVQEVAPGDGCWALADKCRISSTDLTKFNPGLNCDHPDIKAGDFLCCSPGQRPYMGPKSNPDGTCQSYTAGVGEGCWIIGDKQRPKITTAQVEEFNKRTWGFEGCGSVRGGDRLCVSPGNPPIPSPDPAYDQCGPRMPGIKPPMPGQNLEEFNPCPLNACCNKWGKCGVTDEFCTKAASKTGAPGTSALQNGCISNCGKAKIQMAQAASTFRTIGYYEAYSVKRQCLKMEVNQLDRMGYTYYHFAFANINKDYTVDVGDLQPQFEDFKRMSGVQRHRIVSFGGWAFSTGDSTYTIFREGVKPANRQKLAMNIAGWLMASGLDGVDFDWEYPGEPDQPGIPPDSKDSGKNYLEFLRLLKSYLPNRMTISIAAPASYWYLRGFPIKEIAELVDYIVYMTYDLHGQWDYGNIYAIEGCDHGDCLRSHVNFTETTSALAMLQKAGVPSSKITVGISSYGRAFKMAQTGCDGPNCKYLGPKSYAKPGRCTNEAGYLADAEIKEILKTNKNVKHWTDLGSKSNILVYDDTQWVSYLTRDQQNERREYFRTIGFGGIVDWAVDLEEFFEPVAPPLGPWEDPGTSSDCSSITYTDWNDILNPRFNTAKANCGCVDKFIAKILKNKLQQALDKYRAILKAHYDRYFTEYATHATQNVRSDVASIMLSMQDKYFECVHEIPAKCCVDMYCNNNRNKGLAKCKHCNNAPRCDVNSNKVRSNVTGENCKWTWEYSSGLSLDQSTYYINRDQQKWVEALAANKSILAQWIKYVNFINNSNNAGSSKKMACTSPWDTSSTECADLWWTVGFPRDAAWPSPTSELWKQVANPKDTVEKGLENMQHVMDLLSSAETDPGSIKNEHDIVDASMLPVYLIVSAVESMDKIEQYQKHQDDLNNKRMILGFAAAIVSIIPIAGEVGAIAEATALTVRGVLGLLGEMANAVKLEYDIMANPDSGPAKIMKAFLKIQGGKTGKFGAPVVQAADEYRKISADQKKAMGDVIRAGLDDVQNARNACVMRPNLPTTDRPW